MTTPTLNTPNQELRTCEICNRTFRRRSTQRPGRTCTADCRKELQRREGRKTPQVNSPDPLLNERRAKALTMRNAGATWERVAQALGVSVGQAQKDVARAIKLWVRVPADQMVERQRAVLLDLMRVEYPAAMDPSSSRHYAAVDRVLEILRDERKLFGLDAPQKISLGISEEEFAARASELLAVTGDRPLRELAGQQLAIVDAEVVEDPSVQAVAEEPEEPWSNL